MEHASTERLLLVSVPSLDCAHSIAQSLVQSGSAACVTRLPVGVSIYSWNGRVEESEEILLMIKTDSRCISACERLICEQHPYEVPEIIALSISDIHAPYRAWMQSTLGE